MRSFILLILLAAAMSVAGQAKRVTVTDWGSRSIIIFGNFFDETKDSIIAQIGAEEFEQVKLHCSKAGWPEGLYSMDLDEEADKQFDKKLNELKMYKIADYTHRYKGKTFERYVILRVPYEENRNWNPAVKWQGNIYFLVNLADTKEL